MMLAHFKHERWRFSLAVLVLLGPGQRDRTRVQADTGPDATDVIVKTIREDDLAGRLLSFSLADGLVLQTRERETQKIDLPDMVRLVTKATRAKPRPGEAAFTLVGGDVLRGRVGDRVENAAEEGVTLTTSDIGSITLPLDLVHHMVWARSSSSYRKAVAWLDRHRVEEEDRVLLANGDVLGGFVNAIDAKGVTVEGAEGVTMIPRERVVALQLTNVAAKSTNRPYLWMELRRSGRIAAVGLDWSKERVMTTLVDGQTVRIEPRQIVQIEVVGGKWEWLAQHRPISFEHTPMMSLGWHYRIDRNVAGNPMRVAGKTYSHGVGVHSRSRLTYDLKGDYRELVTYLGIDDDSGPYADVNALIRIDGQSRFRTLHVRRGKLLGPIRLDVTHANRIELIVEFGDNGDLQDRCNWVDAALIR